MELSKVNPDYKAIVNQFTSELQSRGSWKDVLSSSTGQTIIEFIAASTTLLYSEILRAVDEINIGTAKNTSSVYALANLLGVPIRRSVGAEVTVTLNIPSGVTQPITLNKYDAFTIEDVPFFITQTLVIPANTTIVSGVKLRQGTVNTYNFTSSGTPFQQFIIGQNYTTDDKYLDVQVNNDPIYWTMISDSLWQYNSTDKVYQVISLPDGTVRVLFGDGSSGVVPSNGFPIKIIESSTLGSSGNKAVSSLSVVPVIKPVVNSSTVDLTGTTTSSISGGDNQESVDRLRFTIPRFFASAKRAITREDWAAIGLKYPQVADIKVWGEYEEGLNLNMMNTVKVSLLMSYGPVNVTDQGLFDTYINDYKCLNTRVLYVTPVPVLLSVNVNVYVKIGFSLVQVQSNVRSAIEEYFKAQPGVLGKSVYVSDINNILSSVDGVDYVQFNDLVKPTNLLTVKNPALPTATSSTGTVTPTPFTSGGSMADGTKYYKVSAIDANGIETAASPEASATVTGGGGSGRIDLAWTAVTGASSYRIYRGTASGAQSIYFTSGTNSYSDTDGSSTAGTPKAGTLAAATHYFGVSSIRGSVETSISPEASKVVPGANGSITINWTAVSGADSYNIYVGTATGQLTKRFSTTNLQLYYDGSGGTTVTTPNLGVIVDGTYYYVVTGVDSKGKEMAKSSEVSIAVSITGANNSVGIIWTGVTEAVSYNVYRGVFSGGQNIKYTGITTTYFLDRGLTGTVATPPTIVPILKDPILVERFNYLQLQPTPIVTTISSNR